MGAKSLDTPAKTSERPADIGSQFSAKMRKSAGDGGSMDGVKQRILSMVANEFYDRAIDSLKDHLESKNEYPKFKQRAVRYIEYSIDLVNAIKAKRSFPGLQHLAMSKQQELFERSMVHFDDLKATLKKVEQIDFEVRIEDVRSTVLVVRVAIYCVFAILALGFFLEVSRGALPSIYIIVDKYFTVFVEWIFSKVGW